MAIPATSHSSAKESGIEDATPTRGRGFDRILLGWMGLMVLVQALRWAAGTPGDILAAGVEEGASRAESRVRGEVGDEVIRKAIRSQRETLPFWAVVTALGDFLVEPFSLAARAVAVATLFSGIAALSGRTPRYDLGLLESSKAQGFWVLGLAARLALAASLGRGEADVETSAALLLPPGRHPAALWLALRQVDLFAMAGWALMAHAAGRRGESPRWLAWTLCLLLAFLECAVRVAAALGMGGALRLSPLVE
ncbi:hypothetical protein OJF2_58090 [Aquisphaera giovannonii]|uniref:Yip1 domain protein n=1 Tax=Aquisphaera giovannonii TaxID=406548 RepID=A0A5B9W9F8_9BACT|nr:hypothetical protein [Aquisphaera giovannonii]QEH37222.1 hypothetical protein OJF2_58090 [Aquisphaera giovannonii]